MSETADISTDRPPAKQPSKPIVAAIIVLSSIGGMLALAVPVGFLFWLNDQEKQATVTGADLEQRAKAFLQIDALPLGFVYQSPSFSINSGNTGQVLITNVADGTSFYFERNPLSKLPSVKKRMQTVGGIGDHFTVKESGELQVAGKALKYVRGISQRDTGAVFNELRGYIGVDSKNLIEVATGTPEARPLNMDAVKQLLGSVKAIR